MPDPLPTARFNHANLSCSNVERSVAFYSAVLGLYEVPRPGFPFRGAWLYREGLGMMLHLNETPDFHEPGGQAEGDAVNPRRRHLAFRVTDVDRAVELLNEHGVEYVRRTLPDHGYRQVFFRDPDGNVLEVGEWPDVEEMGLAKPEGGGGKAEDI